MRIALVARGCRPGGGIERYTFELARRLSGRHDVTVITQPQEYADCGARLVPVNTVAHPKWLSILEFSRQAGRLAWQGDYDIVHAQGSDSTWGDVVTAHSCHAAGMRASLKMGPTWINLLRKALSPGHHSVLLRERQAYNSAVRLITVTHRVGRQLKATYPELKSKLIEVVHPGVTPPASDQSGDSLAGQALRRKLGLTPGTVLWVLVANDPVQKGALRLIQALAHNHHQATAFLICSAMGTHRGLHQAAMVHQVNDRVFFLSTPRDANQALAAADVVTGLPDYESFGLALLEAMAWGKPLVTSNQVGIMEILKGRPPVGLMVPANIKPAALGKIMAKVSADEAQRQAWGRSARAIARLYSWEKMTLTLEKRYARVLAFKKDHYGIS